MESDQVGDSDEDGVSKLSPARVQSWNELRRRVLEEGYLTLEELEEQRALVGSLKHIIWATPFFIAVLVALVILGGLGVLEVAAFILILGSIVVTAWWCARQEHRWQALIRERSAATDANRE